MEVLVIMVSFSADKGYSNHPIGLGPDGPFPRAALTHHLDRRWLHYAFLSRDGKCAMVANAAWLGPPLKSCDKRERFTTILLLHDDTQGWHASQFNADISTPHWSAFALPHAHDRPARLDIAAPTKHPKVALKLWRSSRPCTSQSAFFAQHQHLRWQSETGVYGSGEIHIGKSRKNVEFVGYHERVRGRWGWPDLGEWVFGFANDLNAPPGKPPEWSGVFTFIRPVSGKAEEQASFMLWRKGRLVRHFPRRNVSFAVRGSLSRDDVTMVPSLPGLLGTPAASMVPRRLMITAILGNDHVVLDFDGETAARIVIPSETSYKPFSVHEVLGGCHMHGEVNGEKFQIETRGIVEFAGGATHD